MSRLQKVVLTSLLAIFLSHPALATTSEQEMLAQGKQHLQNQKYSFATTWFERLLKNYPATSHRKEVLLLMAQGYLATDKEEKAADALRKLIKQYPEEAAKLSPRQLELAKRPPRPEATGQDQPAPASSSVISGGLMADRAIPIPIIDPPLENPGEPEMQQVPPDATNVYATSAPADNAIDISETRRRDGDQRGVEIVRENEAPAARVSERPAVKAIDKSTAVAPAVAPVKVVPSTTESAPPNPKPAAADKKAAVGPPPTAPPTTPLATTLLATNESATKPSAAAPSKTVLSTVTPSVAAQSVAAQSVATPAAKAPAAKAPAAAASVAVAPPIPAQLAKTNTAPPPALPRVVAPAKLATPKPADKSVTVEDKAVFALKIGEYLLPPEISEVKQKLVKAGLSPQVVEGPKKKVPVLRLEVEGVTDQASAQKKLENVRKASGTGIIMVSKEGRRRLYAGSYLNEKVAEKEQQRLAAIGIKSSLQKAVAPVPTYSVTAGPFATREAALEGGRKLAIEGVQAVVVQMRR